VRSTYSLHGLPVKRYIGITFNAAGCSADAKGKYGDSKKASDNRRGGGAIETYTGGDSRLAFPPKTLGVCEGRFRDPRKSGIDRSIHRAADYSGRRVPVGCGNNSTTVHRRPRGTWDKSDAEVCSAGAGKNNGAPVGSRKRRKKTL
jgi:hypothetical protein